MINLNKVYFGDCLELMDSIENNSIDMILCDLPYGITSCDWDKKIPLVNYIIVDNKILYEDEYIIMNIKKGKSFLDIIEYFKNNCKEGLWNKYNRIIKENGVIVLTSSQPYTTELINSNKINFKYELIWDKENGSDFLNSNKRPMKSHENICIFYKKTPIYNKQVEKRYKNIKYNNEIKHNNIINSFIKKNEYTSKTYVNKCINSVIRINSQSNELNNTKRLHSTQKPIELFEYLIKMYTNENQVVLDSCAGSGTTAIACINTNRKYICIENNKKFFDICNERIKYYKKPIECIKSNETYF